MSEAPERACQFGAAEWLDEVGDMQTKEPDEERILVSWVDKIAFMHRIAGREIGVGRSGRGHPPARRDRDALDGDFGGHVYSSGLRPGAGERFRRASNIMTA